MTDSRCPTCLTAIPEGAGRCPACGRVFGEENRCPHCHAVAAVRPAGNITVCAACGKPRAGTVRLDGGKVRGIRPATRVGIDAGSREMQLRLRARTRRLAGALAIAMAVALAMVIPVLSGGGLGYLVAAVVAAAMVALGGVALRSGSAALRSAEQQGDRARGLAIRELAASRSGRLTAADVAAAFEISTTEADAALTSMVGDGSEVDVQVDDDGRVEYVFRALALAGPRVRVDAGEGQDEAEVEVEPRAREATRRRE